MKRTLINKLRRFGSDTTGAALTELAIIIPLLLLLVFGAVEFGRFGHNETLAQKATDLAARTAAVRSPVCDDVPLTYEPPEDTGANPPRFGTLCRFGEGACAAVPERSCTLEQANATSNEIWQTISPLLPAGSGRSNVRIRYTFDPALGFLGGPYTPIVTAEIEGLNFQFISPLGALAALSGAGDGDGVNNSIPFPSMSASLPAEDLGQGTGG